MLPLILDPFSKEHHGPLLVAAREVQGFMLQVTDDPAAEISAACTDGKALIALGDSTNTITIWRLQRKEGMTGGASEASLVRTSTGLPRLMHFIRISLLNTSCRLCQLLPIISSRLDFDAPCYISHRAAWFGFFWLSWPGQLMVCDYMSSKCRETRES